ncbi:glycosyltransferase [Uliginosibacterium sp. H3]|uniref:Glycosyltransferase n=1 Tax=Uliginosibacterium silvisoli TaxID=3114758 RepID=A0ABU6K6Z2_9RHOO|nr:glycosyltransferase [Uliginosibacterium sp. H3]
MRILVVIPTVFGGGAEQVAAILAREWSGAHEVRVLAWQGPGESLDFGVPVRFANLGVQQGLARKLRNVWRRVCLVRQEMQRFRPEVVMAFMDEAGMPCVLAAATRGELSRLIVSVHHNPQWMPRWRRILLGLFYRFPAAVVAVSRGVRDELVGALHLQPKRLRHIPNPLVTRVVPVEAQSLDVANGLDDRMPNGFLLAVGRIDRYTKGLDVLIAAYASLPTPRPGLVIVGDGPDRKLVEEDARRAGVEHEVLFTGWLTDPRPFYRRAALFVLASRYEGWSNVLMEAMGEGCPVVATRCPYGPPEILGEDLAHLLVAPDDVAALAQGIQMASALGRAEREALSLALRERVQCFAADKVAAQWIDLAGTLQGRAST